MGTISRIGDQSLSLTERLIRRQKSWALLLDVSGSMKTDLEPGFSRIDALKQIVLPLEGDFNIFAFNDRTMPVTKDTIPEPSGGTYMSQAIQACKARNHKKIIMVTDGCDADNDKAKAITEAAGVELKIMYVGPSPKPVWLDALATSGFATQEDLKKPAALTEKIQLLIGDGKSGGSIQL